MNRPVVVCFGWDVGGWMGRKHGAAGIAWRPESGSVEFLGRPCQFRIKGSRLDFLEFVSHAVDGGDLAILEDAQIIVGVDAPLGYPNEYRRLVSGEPVNIPSFAREIENAFAYRETERHVYQRFGKKPLSAPFDKLGNNASVAISQVRRWAGQHELKVVPFEHAGPDDNVIIEVYPALAKTLNGEINPHLARYVSDGAEPGSDAYDAAVCAVTALAFAARGGIEGLPRTSHPEGGVSRVTDEGWIYYMLDS